MSEQLTKVYDTDLGTTYPCISDEKAPPIKKKRYKKLEEIIEIAELDGGVSDEEFDFLIAKAVAMGFKQDEAKEYINAHVVKKKPGSKDTVNLGRLERKFYKNSWALVIGINSYEQEEIPNLRFAENDAKAVASALPALGFPKENIKLLVSGETRVTRVTINNILEMEFGPKMKERDRFLFYFAGHGISYKVFNRTAGYMLMQDSKLNGRLPGKSEPYLNRIPGGAIEMEQFLSKVKLLPVKHKLLLLDSCFSGFMTSARDIPGNAANGAKMLAQWSREPVTQVITAGRSGQKAYEEETDRHGIFTRYLLKGLEGHATPRQDGVISFMDLAAYIRDRVAREKGARQDPQFSQISGEGQFFFLLPGNNKTTPTRVLDNYDGKNIY